MLSNSSKSFGVRILESLSYGFVVTVLDSPESFWIVILSTFCLLGRMIVYCFPFSSWTLITYLGSSSDSSSMIDRLFNGLF